MLKLKSEYINDVLHDINDLDKDLIDMLKEKHPDFLYKYFDEV